MTIRRFMAAIAAACLSTFAQGAPPAVTGGPSTAVQVMNGPSNPVPVDGVISGEVEIINTEPINVTVVPPSLPNQVVCVLSAFGAVSNLVGGYVSSNAAALMSGHLSCPAGVNGVLARRAVLTLSRAGVGLFAPENVQNMIAIFGFAKQEGGAASIPPLEQMNIIAGLSLSNPEKVLDKPILVTPNRYARVEMDCFGVPTAKVACRSGLYLIGDPVLQ